MPLPVGTTLGRYEIRSPIGKGRMGEVYLAYDSQVSVRETSTFRELNELAQ